MDSGEQADAAVGLLFPSSAKSCSATLTKSSRNNCASAGNVMPLRMQSRTSGRNSRASGACSFAAAFGWCEAGFEIRELAFMANRTGTRRGIQSHFLSIKLTCEIFPHIEERQPREIDACLASRSEFPLLPPEMSSTERDKRMAITPMLPALLRSVIFLAGLAAPFVVALLARWTMV